MEYYRYSHQNKYLLLAGKLCDSILYFLKIFRLNKYKIKSEDIKKILIFESHLIGDCVMTTALIKGLQELFPSAKIDILANNWMESLVKKSIINSIFSVKVPWSTYDYSYKNILSFLKIILFLRKKKYDLSIETRGEIRNSLTLFIIHSKFRLGVNVAGGTVFLTDVSKNNDPYIPNFKKRLEILKYLGGKNEAPEIQINVTDDDILFVKNYLKENNLSNSKYILFHPGGSHPKKSFTLEQIIQIFESYKDTPVVIAYGPNELTLIDRLKKHSSSFDIPFFYFQGTFGAFCQLAKYSSLVVTSDSGPAHLTAATNSKCIVVCPHDKPETVRPHGQNIIMLQYNEVKDNLNLNHLIMISNLKK